MDMRLLATTHRDVPAMIQAGTFREDLYARLNRIVVRIPPLRERREDIMPLARHFAREFAGRRLRFDFSLGQALVLHDWPGNARSLQGIVERLVIEQEGEEVLAAPSWLADELAMHARKGEKQKTEAAPAPKREIDGDELRALLKKHQGKVTAVASELGIGRNTLYRWLRKYNIDIEDYRVEG